MAFAAMRTGMVYSMSGEPAVCLVVYAEHFLSVMA